MKKILVLLIGLFIITGCTAEYNLTFEDGVFSENIIITEPIIENSDGSVASINDVKNDPNMVKIDEDYYYDVDLKIEDNNNILTLNFKYEDISIDKSLVHNSCFSDNYFFEEDDYYYFKLVGDRACEYLGNADITFKTDKAVITSNADEIDEENGIYKWNDFDGGEIIIQVSKTRDLNAKVEKSELIPVYVKIIIALVVGGIIFIVYRKIKKDHE